jgi:hypothetical protein
MYWQVRVKCPHCSIILDLPVSTTKFKCAKCAAISNITAASQASTPEQIFERAQKTEAIIAPAGKTTSDRVLLQQLLGHLILEIRDLKRRNVDDDAVKLESGPKLEEAVKKKADLDGDGIITEAELREVYGQKEDPNVTKLKEMVLQADLDGDGVVSDDELMQFAKLAMVAKVADVDGDGNVSEEELKARYGDPETARKFMAITEGSEDIDAVLSEQELQRLVSRVESKLQSHVAPNKPEVLGETDEQKAERMLKAHHERQQSMKNMLDADKQRQQDELEKQLMKRRRRKVALKRMANEKAMAEATNLAQIEDLLAKITAEAMEDGLVDEDEQKDIDAAKQALERSVLIFWSMAMLLP